eukprot:6420413-Prymnesium_polylepis.1
MLQTLVEPAEHFSRATSVLHGVWLGAIAPPGSQVHVSRFDEAPVEGYSVQEIDSAFALRRHGPLDPHAHVRRCELSQTRCHVAQQVARRARPFHTVSADCADDGARRRHAPRSPILASSSSQRRWPRVRARGTHTSPFHPC